jgi:hypothetical protein
MMKAEATNTPNPLHHTRSDGPSNRLPTRPAVYGRMTWGAGGEDRTTYYQTHRLDTLHPNLSTGHPNLSTG